MGEVEQPHCIVANWKTKRKARRSWLGRKWHGMSQSNFIRLKLLKLGLGLGWEMLTQPNVGLGAILTNLLILILLCYKYLPNVIRFIYGGCLWFCLKLSKNLKLRKLLFIMINIVNIFFGRIWKIFLNKEQAYENLHRRMGEP